MSLEEAGRQLEAAIHDARVAFDCIALEDLERSHTSSITARAAVDAAEYAIRVELERRASESAETSPPTSPSTSAAESGEEAGAAEDTGSRAGRTDNDGAIGGGEPR